MIVKNGLENDAELWRRPLWSDRALQELTPLGHQWFTHYSIVSPHLKRRDCITPREIIVAVHTRGLMEAAVLQRSSTGCSPYRQLDVFQHSLVQ